MELYKKHRPTRLKDVVGQPKAVKACIDMLANDKVPHAILLTGPSGCGKTTIARILAKEMDCPKNEFKEMDCGLEGGKDVIRNIDSVMGYSIIDGTCRIFYVDEAHGLSSQAQEAMLKMLEDSPEWVYFFLATTSPAKLKPTIRNRCTEVHVNPLSNESLTGLIRRVAKKEQADPPLDDEVVAKIVTEAMGSARKSLVILEPLLELDNNDQRLNAIVPQEAETKGIDIARALMDRRTRWSDMVKLLKSVDGDYEQIRRVVLGYATSCLLNSKPQGRAATVIDFFRDPWDHWYDNAKACMVVCCWSVMGSK